MSILMNSWAAASRPSRITAYSLALVSGLASLTVACAEDRRPIGASCGESSECAEGECLAGYCLDPNEDTDGDGLLNKIEAALGTDPTQRDTDGDGLDDGDEIGNDVQHALDADHDGHVDAIESNVVDADSDCIVNQLDPEDAVPETDPHTLASFVCKHVGVCVAEGASVTATCVASATAGKNTANCDYSGVPGYEAEEISCNDKDDDCNGTVDENFGVNGTIKFTEGGETKVKGNTCGIGACAGGTVICGTASTLACSSATLVTAERCNAVDDDCDGQTDEDFKAGGTQTYDGGPNGNDAGKVLGDACGAGACAGGTVACAADPTKLTCSTLNLAGPKACGADANCDSKADTAGPGEELVGCTRYWHDDDGDTYGYGDPICVCAPDEGYPALADGDCNEKDPNVHPGALPLCGVDADCQGGLVDTMEACDDGNKTVWDGCFECKISELLVTKLGGGGAPIVAADAGGGFAMAWDLGWDASETYLGREIHFYDQTHEVGMYTGLDAGGWDSPLVWLTGLRGGGFLEVKQTSGDGIYFLYATSYTAAGVAVGDPVLLATSQGRGDFYEGSLVALDGHRAAFVYPSTVFTDLGQENHVTGVYIGEDGKLEEPGFEFDPGGSPSGLRAVGTADGQIIVTFVLYDLQTYDQNAYFLRVGKDKMIIGKLATAHDHVELEQPQAAVVTLPNGEWAVVYMQEDPVPPESTERVLYLQAFDANGEFKGAARKLGSLEDIYVYDLDAVANAAGDIILSGSAEQSEGPPPAWLAPVASGLIRLELDTPEYLSSPGDPHLVALSSGDFVVGFRAYAGEEGSGGFVSRVTPIGERVPVFPWSTATMAPANP